MVDPLGMIVLVDDVDEDVFEPALNEEPAGLFNGSTDRRLVIKFLILAGREQADHYDHAAPVRLADQPLEASSHLGLKPPVTPISVQARVGVGPAAVGALDVDAKEVNPVRRHVVQVVHMPLGNGVAEQRVTTPETPEIDLLTGQERPVVFDLELLGRSHRPFFRPGPDRWP